MAQGKWTPETPWFKSNKKTQAVWPTYVCRNPNCKSYGKSHPNCECGAPSFSAQSRALEYSKGGVISEHFCSTGSKHKKDCEYYSDGGPVDDNDGGDTTPRDSSGPSVDRFLPLPLKYIKKTASDLLVDEPPTPGDESIRPVNDPFTAIAGGYLAGPAQSAMESAAPHVERLITEDIGAIRKTPTGRVLGTVDPEAGGTTLRQNFLNQAKEQGMSLTKEEKGSIPTVKEIKNNIPSASNSPIDLVKARYGDDKKLLKEIDRIQNPETGPWGYLSKSNAGVPNYASEPTGTIGADQITHQFPSLERQGHPTDPVPWMDMKYGSTKQLLQKHQDLGLPLTVNTSSDLIAHDDYINAMPKDATVRMHLLTDNDHTNRMLFPGNPSQKRQLQAIEKLKSAGINVVPVRPTTDKIIDAAGGIEKVCKELIANPNEAREIIRSSIGLQKVPNDENYASGGVVEGNEQHPQAKPLPDDSSDDPKATLGHSAIEHGLIGLLNGSIGDPYLSKPHDAARIIDDAKRQHQHRSNGTPEDGKEEQGPKRSIGTNWGDHIFEGRYDKAAEALQDNPLVGSGGKSALEPVLTRLTKPMIEKETNPEAFRGASDYLNSSARGYKKLKESIAHVMGSYKAPTHLQEMSRESDRKELKEHLNEAKINPAKLIDVAGSLGHYLPEHAGALGFTVANAVKYLESLRPKQTQMSPLDGPSDPSPVAVDEFNRQIDLANHPLLVVDHIKDGTLSAQDIQTVKTIYPGLFDSITKEANEEIINSETKGTEIPYSHRMGLSMILGQPLDGTMTQASMMAIITSQGPQTPEAQQNKSPTTQTQKTIDKTEKIYQTPEQRRELDKHA